MQLKIRKQNMDGEVRLETRGKVTEIRIREDFMRPGRETVELCFRGNTSSGIIAMNSREFDSIAREVGSRTRLVKSVKLVKEEV
jgi:hypothetical protein